MLKHCFAVAVSVAALVAATPLIAKAQAASAAAPATPELGSWGVDLTGRDLSVRPGDDFWRHANGAWDKRTEIAPDRTSTGSFVSLSDRSEAQVRAIVEDVAKTSGAPGSPAQQIGDMYASWMDIAAIEARGTAPLAPCLARIAAVNDRAGLIKLLGSRDFSGPVGIGITIDPGNPDRYIAGTAQAGIGMPNRDFYLKTDGKFPAFQVAYKAYIAQMLTLAGISDAAAKAERIYALESRIATAHWTPERSRDVTQSFNPMTRAELVALAPQFDWPVLLTDLGLGALDTIVVRQTSAIADAGKLLDSVPLATWKDYLTFHFINDNAANLPRAFDEANFAFFGKTLRDQPVQRDRWKRGVALVGAGLGEAIGQLYVARHYPPTSNAKMAELIADLRASLEERIKTNSWMDAPTRAEALNKLASFDPRIGHPAKWIDYAPLAVTRDDLFGNALRARRFAWDLQLSRLPKPVDRGLWVMTPQTVNAYYSPLTNQITFPAAILQPPFFDPNADPAVNYGGIGAVIGHEIGHGFDDQGRRFDATGRLRDWWTPEAAANYQKRADALGAQFSAIEGLPGLFINGKLSMGENIGDLSGLEMAYGAWRRYVAKYGEPPVKDGLSGDQRFFLAFAQIWRGKRREGALREQLINGPHSPEFARGNAVRNADAWYKAFDVKPGDKMYLPPEARVKIW
ncbi:MAG: M13 family metallopeptidase [Sphingomonadaceae bacterium]